MTRSRARGHIDGVQPITSVEEYRRIMESIDLDDDGLGDDLSIEAEERSAEAMA